RRDRAECVAGGAKTARRSRLPHRAWAVVRSSTEAQPASAGDDRSGNAHFRYHSRRDQLVAGASQARLSTAGARRPKNFGMTAALVAGLSALELDADIAARAKLSQYIALLDKWNRTHNLTAIRDPAQM